MSEFSDRAAAAQRLADLARNDALEEAALLVDCARLGEMTDLNEIAASIRALKTSEAKTDG